MAGQQECGECAAVWLVAVGISLREGSVAAAEIARRADKEWRADG
jgi:hypothetical protein